MQRGHRLFGTGIPPVNERDRDGFNMIMIFIIDFSTGPWIEFAGPQHLLVLKGSGHRIRVRAFLLSLSRKDIQP